MDNQQTTDKQDTQQSTEQQTPNYVTQEDFGKVVSMMQAMGNQLNELTKSNSQKSETEVSQKEARVSNLEDTLASAESRKSQQIEQGATKVELDERTKAMIEGLQRESNEAAAKLKLVESERQAEKAEKERLNALQKVRDLAKKMKVDENKQRIFEIDLMSHYNEQKNEFEFFDENGKELFDGLQPVSLAKFAEDLVKNDKAYTEEHSYKLKHEQEKQRRNGGGSSFSQRTNNKTDPNVPVAHLYRAMGIGRPLPK